MSRSLVWVGLAAVAAFELLWIWKDPIPQLAEALDAARALPTWNLIGCLALSLANYGLRFVRWNYYVRYLGFHVPFPDHCLIYVAGFAFTLTPGKVGETIRASFLMKHGVTITETVSLCVVERILDLCAMLTLAILVVTVWRDALFSLLLAAIILAAIVGLLFYSEAGWSVISRLKLSVPRGTARALSGFEKAAVSMRGLVRHRFASTLLLSALAWGAEGLGLWLLASVFKNDLSIAAGIGAYATSVLVGAMTFLPGGLGGAELAMTSLLVLCGLTPATAIICTLVCRVTTLWFAVGLGAIAVPIAVRSGSRKR